MLDHPLRFLSCPGGRLLAEDMLAGIGGSHRPLRVQMIRQRDVDRIYVPVAEKLVVGADPRRVAQLWRVGDEIRAEPRFTSDRDELNTVRAKNRRDDDLARDVGGA